MAERALAPMPTLSPMTEKDLATGLRFLAGRDPDLARILDDLGPPPMWAREPGFPTLLHVVLEQQVSLASAKAAFVRLLATTSPLTPERFLELDDAQLKAIGFSRQKAAYGRYLSRAVLEGRIDLTALGRMDDAGVRLELTQIKGIGPWTAEMYLLMALRRPDAWPSSDLALAAAVQRLMGLDNRPAPEYLDTIAAEWRPWRAVAARLLWHYYLADRARKKRHELPGQHIGIGKEGEMPKAVDDSLTREETLK